MGSTHLITEGKKYGGKHAGITYAEGSVIQRFEYAPYGRETFALNLNQEFNPSYTGQKYDIETGLYWYRSRYYNPIVARFMQPDTIIPDPTDPQSYNRYTYVANNPLKYTDPSGHDYVEHGIEFTDEGSIIIKLDPYGNGATSEPATLVSTHMPKPTIDTTGDGGSSTENAIARRIDGNGFTGGVINSVVGGGSRESVGTGANRVSGAGLNFIAGYEGYSAVVYNDVAGLATIGYGHLIKPSEVFSSVTKEQALQLLRLDASFAVGAVNKYVTVDLSQHQFDALVSFTFNVGVGAFSKSSLLRNVNMGNQSAIAESFIIWNKARIGGVLKSVPGLTSRRRGEANLFLKGAY